MKLLLINSVCGVGSTGRIITDLATSVFAEEHKCYIAYGLGEAKNVASDNIETKKICSEFEYKISNIVSKVTGLTGCFNNLATSRLLKYIDEVKPDVVHIHNIHGYYINAFALFKHLKKRNIPVVWTLHDCWAFTGNCSHYSYAGCERWKDSCGNCPQKERYPKSYLFDFSRFLLRKKTEVFAAMERMILTTPSKWLAGEVAFSFLKKYECVPIYNGMDTVTFDIGESHFKENHSLQDKKIVLGVANAWSRKKGLFDIYQLAEQLPEEYCVVLVGLDDEQMKGLPSNILGIKRTANIQELVDIYNAAEVFVNPSYEETFGMVSIEALLCGTPVVAYNKTALPEIVDSEYGVVVEAGNIDALADAVVSIDKAPRKDIRMSALKYSKENMTRQYWNLYKRIIERNAAYD